MSGATSTDNVNEGGKEYSKISLFEDILDLIFKNMSMKDLHRAATVCTVWRTIAKREISRRNEIQGLILPIIGESNAEDDYGGVEYEYGKTRYLKTWHLSDSLMSFPNILLLFHDGTYEGPSDVPEDFYINYYWQSMQRRVIVFDALGVTQNNTEIVARSNKGLGIAIPNTSGLELAYFYPSMHDKNPDEMNKTTLTKLLDEVENDLSISGDKHNCFIYFESSDADYSEAESPENYYAKNRTFTKEIFQRLQARCKPGSYSLFGGFIPIITFGRNEWADCFLLKISGSAMNSWSIVVEENSPKKTLEEKLMKFKESVKLKSHSIALAMVPSTENESYQERLKRTELFREIFPNVNLFGIYNEQMQFGVNSTCSDPTPTLEYQKAVVYLIITTD